MRPDPSEDAAAAHQAGAVFGGLIFVAKSPVTWTSCRPRRDGGAPLSLRRVFRNASPATIAKTVDALGLAAVQLHGDEDAAYVEALRRRCCRQAADLESGWSPLGESGPYPPSTTRRIACRWIRKSAARAAAPVRPDWTLLAGPDKSKLMLAGAQPPTTPSRPPRWAVWP